MTERLHTEYVLLADVKEADRNPRVHASLEQVKGSIRRFGFVEHAVHDGRTGKIIAGHGRKQALTEMEAAGEPAPRYVDTDPAGRWMMPVSYGWSSASDAEAETLLVSLNRLVETGGWNERELAELLSDVRATEDVSLLDLTGYDEDDLNRLLKDIAKEDRAKEHEDKDLDEVPNLYATPKSRVGDVWILGRHRLAVGDCLTMLDAVLVGDDADMVFTDPPYGVAYYQGMSLDDAERLNHRKDGKTVANDVLQGPLLEDFLRLRLGAAHARCRPGANWYVCAPATDPFLEFAVVGRELAVWRHTIVWLKHRFVFGQSDYHYQHESIMYGWKSGAAHQPPPSRDQSSVWEFDMPHKSEDHPTMKPVGLVSKAIRNSSDDDAIVLDPFGGSGTTMIAAEVCGRRARLVELDPRYADGICRRFQKLTGVMPQLESTGEVYDFTLIEQANVAPAGFAAPSPG